MNKTAILEKLVSERILIIDGATGTEIQKMGLSAQDYGGAAFDGCNEYLSLSKPSAVSKVHESYLEAGADIVETNTFGATPVVLGEYGLADKTEEINRAAARLAADAAARYSSPQKPRFVAGSMGPTTKSLFVTGGISGGEMENGYYRQARGLIEGGIDVVLLETAQDVLNLKAGMAGVNRAFADTGIRLPVIISATLDFTGAMLSGQNAEAFYVSLEHYNLFAMGFNCGAGPDQMAPRLRLLSGLSRFPVFCMPNAGLPDENGRYTEKPEDFARKLASAADSGWLNIAGGCCGTSPEHIRALASALAGKKPRSASPARRWAISGTEAVFYDELEPPMLAGERTNSIGSRIFREMIAAGDWDKAIAVGKRQVKNGAHLLDVCLANPERDEKKDALEFVSRLVKAVRVPVMIDSPDPAVAEAVIAACPGKSVWNSVNLEHGPEKLLRAAELNRRYGTALVAGCIDEDKQDGMAVSVERKLQVAERIFTVLSKAGVPPGDIIFDALVFPVSSGQDKYRTSAAQTVAGIRALKARFPECKTVLGVSNVSFGMPPDAREALNSVFLHQCVQAGLDMAIVNSEKLRRYASLSESEKTLGAAVLENATADAVTAFVELFRAARAVSQARPAEEIGDAEFIRRAVLEGARDGVQDAVARMLASGAKPLDVINGPLSSGMAEVGRLFSKGDLIVTEVLQSAEVMKAAVSVLEPLIKKSGSSKRGRMLLATVRGDVHDIGKNLVQMIFESNGFEVIDLGIKVPNETIVEHALKNKPDIIGLSGLLTRSAEAMITVAQDLRAAGIDAPLILGGAALSEKFVALKVAPSYSKGRVFYARDAMHGLESALSLADQETRRAFMEHNAEKQAAVAS